MREQIHVVYSNPDHVRLVSGLPLRASPKTIRPHHCGTYQVVWGLKKSSKSLRKTRIHTASHMFPKNDAEFAAKTVFLLSLQQAPVLSTSDKQDTYDGSSQLHWAATASSAKSGYAKLLHIPCTRNIQRRREGLDSACVYKSVGVVYRVSH